MKPGTLAPDPPRLGWRDAVATLRSEPAHTRILGGSIIMLLGSGLVSVVNFGYNVAVARMLGPTAFGHAAAAVTLLMLVSAITLSFQLVCAKLVAKTDVKSERAAVYSSLLKQSWGVGLVLGSALLLASGPVARYLNLPSPLIVILLALGITFYIPLGTKRGGMQGVCAFTKLSWNYILEASVKFCGALCLIGLGYGVNGAVAAISISVVLAYFIPPASEELRIASADRVKTSFREGMQAIVFFTGQVVINNIDISARKALLPFRQRWAICSSRAGWTRHIFRLLVGGQCDVPDFRGGAAQERKRIGTGSADPHRVGNFDYVHCWTEPVPRSRVACGFRSWISRRCPARRTPEPLCGCHRHIFSRCGVDGV